MKYSDGFWMNKSGYDVNYATQIYEVKATDNSITVYATNQWIGNRGMTLGGPVLEITFTSTLADSIKVTIEHYKGAVKKGPDFTLYEDTNFKPVINEKDEYWELVSNKTSVRIGKAGGAWDIKYFYDGKLLTKEGWRTTSYIEEQPWLTDYRMEGTKAERFYAHASTDEPARIREMLNISVGENIYGFGEKFSTFVKNGQTVEVWNNDGGTCSEQTYKSIPFYVSSRNYGVFVNHPENVTFEVASETVSKVAFSVQGERMEYFVMGGKTIADVLGVYTTLTGKPALPPAYTFGLWLTTSFTTNYDEETVSFFIDEMARRDIPLEVFHFDCFWMKEFHWSDFVWDNRVFPDPAGLLKRIKAKGLNICVWINSYIGQESVLFNEGMEKGYFIKRTNGQVWQWDMWQPGMAIVDFTNPEAYQWFQSKLEVLLDMGVDCFKTDFGERIPSEGVVYHDGSDPKKMHNYYTYLYNKCVYELLERKRGKGQAVLFARSATVGGQKFPVHWGGDCWSDYESMEESLRGGLSLLMSGFGFWAHDIGGFENTSTADVYKRWVAFGLLSSHSRLHGSSSYRVPWVYDDEAVDVVRFFTRLKARLMPYLYKTAIETSVTGVPTMRSMVLEYTEDKTCHYVDKQYMLGDNLLVAPIFNDQSMAEYYLPKGTWTDFFTGEEKEGCGWITEKHGYLSIPLMVKENSIVAIGAHDDKPDYDYGDGAELRLYALKDGKNAEAVVYGMDQKEEIAMTAKREGNQIHITVKSDRNYVVRLVNVAAASVSAGDVKTEGKDTVIGLSGNAEVTVTL